MQRLERDRGLNMWRALAGGLLLGIALGGCTGSDTNFSQYQGFAEYFTAHPPRRQSPTVEERVLLAQYRPRFLLPPGHAGLVDFYRDYIAEGTLYDGEGEPIAGHVTPEILNAHKREPNVRFVHRPDFAKPTSAVVYGRIDHDTVDLGKVGRMPFTFLSYHAVFRASGLPAGFNGWRAAALGLIADLDDWHQLDHYTAATLALDKTLKPVALMLQQHNYHHTYVFGKDLALPADGRPLVDVAIRSNELYPHRAGRSVRPAVRFLDPQALRYLMGFADEPTVAAPDITEGVNEAEYRLEFLPPDDAFYTFQGFLGERRALPGRDGPPGADYNTLPELKPLGLQLLAGFWRENDGDDLARFEASYAKTNDERDFARAQAAVFAAAIQHSADCKSMAVC